ncbi:MAG: 3-dehydroquinate dehydratase [Bacteroides sp.]|nr:MAG: 3-dehydroquinate dehydratase [Bacteroides sp.]
MNISIINGPNLNMIGKREKNIYGNVNFENYYKYLVNEYNNIFISYYQSNSEGLIIDKLQNINNTNCIGIILNAGAFSHTSIAIADCIKSINIPVIEVHISNIYQREYYRHTSYISCCCYGVIIGFGLDSYKNAIDAFINKNKKKIIFK